MDPHLIAMTVMDRVEPTTDAVIRACVDAQNMKTRLCLLGTKGSYRYLQGDQVAKLATTEKYLLAAQQRLLYVVHHEQMAFAAALDPQNNLPVMMEDYNEAFRRRSYAGAERPANAPPTEPEQAKLV